MRKQRVIRHEVIQPLDQSYRLIPLTQGQNAIVDAEDFEWLMQWNWHAAWCEHSKGFYARRAGRGKLIRLHAQIIGAEKVDHKNHNTLDNRKENIRPCTTAENIHNRRKPRNNTSGFKGVSWHKNRWNSHIRIKNKLIHLGCFKSLLDAARAYDIAAKKLHGEFACINGV